MRNIDALDYGALGLNSDADSECEREEVESLELQQSIDEIVHQAVRPPGIAVPHQNMFEQRNAKEGEKVHEQDSEQRHSPQDIDRPIALRIGDRYPVASVACSNFIRLQNRIFNASWPIRGSFAPRMLPKPPALTLLV